LLKDLRRVHEDAPFFVGKGTRVSSGGDDLIDDTEAA
jgi:hypothetical protein